MGRIRNAIRSAVSWVVDKILRPVINWITEAIEWIIAELRYWKHRAFELLAEWLENDWFFLGAVIATIAAAVFFPKILAWFKELAILAWVKSLWEGVKKGIASILDFIHILNLQLINNILTIFWPEWRNLMGQLSDVASALAEELGQGSAYIHSYFSVVHSLAMIQHSFLGTPMELAEAQAFQETSDYLTTINDRFRDYAHNPGNFTRDIIEEIYIPYSETIKDAQQEELAEIRENRDRVIAAGESVRNLDNALKNFISIQPKETAAIMEKRLGPVTDALDEIVLAMDTVIIPKIEGVVEAFETRSRYQDAINRNVIEKMEDPYSLVEQYELYGFDDQRTFEQYIAQIVGLGNEPAEIALAEGVILGGQAITTAIEESQLFAPPQLAEVGEVSTYEIPGPKSLTVGESWFQGEY